MLDAILGHYLSDTLDIESVIQPVKEAVTMHGIPAILNSDQGVSVYPRRVQGYSERPPVLWFTFSLTFTTFKGNQIFMDGYKKQIEIELTINSDVEKQNDKSRMIKAELHY